MKIFDCHLHVESGLENYNIHPDQKNIIFNSIDSYKKHSQNVSEKDAITLIFDYKENFDFVKKILNDKKINALKIHSRIQKIAAADYPGLIEKIKSLNPGLPVIIDAFYFGDDFEFQPNLKYIIQIAKTFPSLPIIVAHSGGIKALEYFYHLKSLENVYFDLSFSLAYLRHTSCFFDFKNLIINGNSDKLMFGTDFPFIKAADQLNILMEIFKECNTKEYQIHKILYSNAATIFNKMRSSS